jgi:hypothetical protein
MTDLRSSALKMSVSRTLTIAASFMTSTVSRPAP